jgi:hypothetical protein
VTRRHETAGKIRRRSKNIYSDNFHVELLCFTRLLNKGLHISVSFCYFKADAGRSLRLGIQPMAAVSGRRRTLWVFYSVL